MKSIDRLAMDIAGKSEVSARETLDRFGFSLAEQSEIIASHMRLPKHSSGWMDADWQAVAVTIRSTMECSIRLGDRLDFGI